MRFGVGCYLRFSSSIPGMGQEHSERKSVHQVSRIVQPGCKWPTVEGSAAETVVGVDVLLSH